MALNMACVCVCWREETTMSVETGKEKIVWRKMMMMIRGGGGNGVD